MGDLHFSCMPCEPLEAEERNKQKLHLRIYSYTVFLPIKAREIKKKITPNRAYGQMDMFFFFFLLLAVNNMYIYVSI